ncbi:MAG: DUF4149 domain-containing protein [Helicobacteraceae bacterium]|nr:DUF4149 domain-containing protein [Helicobacteraceae bacterium]
MKKNYFDALYLIILGTTIGAVIVLGTIVAPVIFHTNLLYSEELLSHYNEGVIMSEFFRRFNYLAYVALAAIVVYEGYLFKIFKRDKIAFLSASISAFSILLFTEVYTPRIITLQGLGVEATMSETFKNLHIASEIDFKILVVSLAVLFVRRVVILTTKEKV